MEKTGFGVVRCGREAALYTLRNRQGMELAVTDLGAALVALRVPDGEGLPVDVVLGYDSAGGYEAGGYFFGAIVGRCANRIGGAAFSLNGRDYQLARNDGGNSLHSGPDCYHLRFCDVVETGESHIALALHSPDGDQGYPAAVDIRVTYTLTEENGVQLHYEAVPQGDTLINLTSHSYFNLNGHGSGPITGHRLWLDAAHFTPADAASVPTGEILPVAGTPMDFRQEKTVGRDIGADYRPLVLGNGYDHNWCIANGGQLRKFARLTGERSGITMEMYTDRPGVQVYTANFVAQEPGKDGAVYDRRHGICFETQCYPDAIHHDGFPSPVCRGGTVWRSTTEYHFTLPSR